MPAKKISKEKIIQAVLETAFKKSPGNTSLSDISTLLHIKKASLYNHFPSRDAIFSASIDYCGTSLLKFVFTPNHIEQIVEQNTAETIFKRIVNRYIKLYEQETVFQMYVFLQSEKYFDYKAEKFIAIKNEKTIEETIKILELLTEKEKIKENSPQRLQHIAVWFCNGLFSLLDTYLAEKREIMRQNPESGIGSLFELPPDDNKIEEIDSFTESFINLIK